MFSCDGVKFENAEEESDAVGSFYFYRDIAICAALFIVSGASPCSRASRPLSVLTFLLIALSSGLMMGLMSTPLIRLQILERSGSENEQKYASALMALVKRHHLLLVSMLLSFTICTQAMPIFFQNLVGDPYVTIAATIPFILIFVQIIPQATCQRYSLTIGYYMSWFVWLLIAITFIVSWPLSKILDLTVGDADSVFLGRKEIKEAIRLNAEAEAQDDEAAPLNEEEVKIIQGAINFRDKIVRDKFVPIDKVFMISDRDVLGPELFNEVPFYLHLVDDAVSHFYRQIKEIGHARVPVYHNSRDLIIGILLVFDILTLNPNDRVRLLSPYSSVLFNVGR